MFVSRRCGRLGFFVSGVSSQAHCGASRGSRGRRAHAWRGRDGRTAGRNAPAGRRARRPRGAARPVGMPGGAPMNRTLERRIRRLEQAAGNRDDDELVEHELSDKSKHLLRTALTGLTPPEELETLLNERRLVPRSCLRPLSPRPKQCSRRPSKGSPRSSRRSASLHPICHRPKCADCLHDDDDDGRPVNRRIQACQTGFRPAKGCK